MRNEFLVDHYCNEAPSCTDCPLKEFIPICGKGWHIALDGNVKQMEAATLIFIGAKMLKEDEPRYEE